jgi:hypothetical protein
MTTQTVNVDAFGYTGTFGAKLRDPDTIATLVATADTVVASGTIASRFVCTFGEVSVIAAGEYLLEFIVNGVSSILYVTLTGVDGETALARSERAVELDSATITSIQSGLATQATLLLVKAQTDLIGSAAGATTVLAAAVLTPGTITEFPDTLTIGDSYTTANGRSIQIPIVDTDGNQISSTGSLDFADATATFVIKRAKETDSTRIITGTAAFTDPVGTGTSGAPYAVVQLTSSETAKGLIGYKYSGVLTFTWPYVGTGTDPEVMSFETDTILFDN